MKNHFRLLAAISLFFVCPMQLCAQTTFNKLFSFGSYGRVGAGFSPNVKGNIGKSMNLNGMGSIGGRMEEADYVELMAALHFKTENDRSDTTRINVQARLAMYSGDGQLIGNVNTTSYGGVKLALPELYAEANNIAGSKWSAWIGAKFFRSNDVHIADLWYFDDHSTQGFGVSYNNTSLAVMFPGIVDTSNAVPPNFYVNIIDGTPRLGLRSRSMVIVEQLFPFNDGKQTFKLLGEFHRLADVSSEDTGAIFNYPSANGWVLGAKLSSTLNTPINGSFNQFSIRYGHGIANGNDGGNSKTWLTYGAPNLETNKFDGAYSLSLVEHVLLNLSRKYSINGYALFTKSHGAADSDNKAPDYYDREIFNRKTEYAIGVRNFWYIKNWFHLITEVHYANRKDGTQEAAGMTKFSLVPTIVPTAKADPWARPHLRLIYSIANYNQFAADNMYSPILKEVGSKRWVQYIGVRAEWWLF